MKKVLILGVAAVQMDAVMQLKKMGCETYTCAMAKDGPAAEVADHFERINFLDEEAVIEYIKKNGINAVYSTGSDLAMPIACRISEELRLPYFVTANVAYTCNHKNAMRLALTPSFEGNVPYQVMGEIERVTVPFPAILKPSDAQGQRGIFLVHSQQEFEKHFEDARNFSREGKVVVEKYIKGQELSVNGYMVNRKLRYFVVSDRETWPEYTGLIHKHVVPAATLAKGIADKIKKIIEEACRKIGIQDGPVYSQMKLDGQSPYIIEMTPRLDGCHMWNILSRVSGINLMKLTFEHLLYGDTSELNNEKDKMTPMELVFFCQKPNTIMDRSVFKVPEDAVDLFWYYNTGDYVRPVNGRFDKVGYYIRNRK